MSGSASARHFFRFFGKTGDFVENKRKDRFQQGFLSKIMCPWGTRKSNNNGELMTSKMFARRVAGSKNAAIFARKRSLVCNAKAVHRFAGSAEALVVELQERFEILRALLSSPPPVQ